MRVPGALPLFSQEVQRAAANSGWLLADRLVRGGGSLVLMVLIGRWLGPRSFGLYSYALAMTALFAPIASLGLEGIVVRNLVLNPEKSGKTLTEALFLRILGGLTALALLFPTLLLQRGERREALVIVLLLGGAYLFQAWDVLDHWFQSRVQSRYAAWVRMPVFLLGGTLKGFLAYRGGSLALLAGVALLEALAGALGLWLVYRFLHGPALFSEFSLSGAGALLRDSWPLVLSGILVLSFLKIDQVMLGTMASMSALGIYASAVRLVELWNLLPQVVLPSVYPTLVKRRGEDPGSYRRTLQRLFSLFAGFSLVAVAVNTLLAPILVKGLFGKDFTEAALPLSVLSLATLFHFTSAVRGQILLIENKTIYHTLFGLIGIFVLVGMNLWLIPLFGPVGAAAANVAACLVSGLATSFLVPELRWIGYVQMRGFRFAWR